jgi:hypothetical protein
LLGPLLDLLVLLLDLFGLGELDLCGQEQTGAFAIEFVVGRIRFVGAAVVFVGAARRAKLGPEGAP